MPMGLDHLGMRSNLTSNKPTQQFNSKAFNLYTGSRKIIGIFNSCWHFYRLLQALSEPLLRFSFDKIDLFHFYSIQIESYSIQIESDPNWKKSNLTSSDPTQQKIRNKFILLEVGNLKLSLAPLIHWCKR
jgi:hypothetical protein